MNDAEITKPPLAPKPKIIISHLSPVAASKFSPSLPRADILHNPNSMSRGPKPPIAPKPKFPADTEGKSSVYTNNNLNKCSNGKVVCLDGELYERNQCNADCPDSESSNEYIVFPEAQLTSKDCNDLEHEHDQNLDSSLENEVSETSEGVEKAKDNTANDEDTRNREVTEDKLHNASDIAEPMEPDSEESTRDYDLSEEPYDESSDAPDGDDDASKNLGEDEHVADCTETKNNEETSDNLELVKDRSDCKTESSIILNTDEEVIGDICEDTIVMPLPTDESVPNCEKAGMEEEELPGILEKGHGCFAHDGDHSAHADLDLNIEGELETNCASPVMLPKEISKETGFDLGPCEDEPNIENCLGESSPQTAAEEEEADPDDHKNSDTSESCQITERRGEEKTEVACEASRDSEEGEEEAVNAENMEDSCQIAAYENECGEEKPLERSWVLENLQKEGASLEDDVISESLPSSQGIEPELEDETVEELSESTVETSKSDELELGDGEVEGNSLSKSIPSPPQQVPLEEELEVYKHGKINVETGIKHVLHKNLSVPEVVIVPEESKERETSRDSLDDPYVLPAENEIAYDWQTDLGADHSKRDELGMYGENNLLPTDCKSTVTRTRSLSGKMPGYVPETVPEETGPEADSTSSHNGPGTEHLSNNFFSLEGKPVEANRALPTKSRRFILYPRSYSVEGREIPVSVNRESDGCVLDDGRIKRTEDNLSLPCVNGSSGSFSQRNHLSSCGLSTPSSVVDIPPPFELAYITKKPITKSSPSLLIENDSPDKYSKKKKSSFKRFLTLKFKKKTESKVHIDVNVSSSRSSSESSYHGPPRLVDLDRRSLSSSPQLKSHVGKLRAAESPSAILFYKDGKRKGTPKSFSRSVSRVESFEDRSRPPFMPLPLTKPRSISFPNADTSDYENIPAMSSDYENIQIPPRRSTRAGTFTEFFEDPSRALSAANENDGYVDMSSFTGFENKQQTTDQETESAYTEPYKVCPVSVIPTEVITSDEEQKNSEEDKSSLDDPSLINKKEGQSRAYLIAQELMCSEKVYVEMLQLLRVNFYESILKMLGEEDESEVQLKQGLSELPEIHELHQDILGELEERVLKWEEHQKVADVFLSSKSRLNHHTAYIKQFDKNLALLDETCLKYSKLATIIQEFESSGGSPQSVKHQLLKVVQRVFQYRVLLTDYLNNLCPDSAEYEATQAALFIVSEITDQANDSMLQAENLQKLVHIQHSVRGQSGLLQPGRIFVKEGTLMKVSGKNRHPRHLFLMNDVLLYTYPQKDGKYRLKNTLAVSGMKVSCPVTEKAQNILKIEYDEYCLTLSASSCSERDDWYNCISRHIPEDDKAHNTSTFHSSVELRERLGIPLGERPPTLVPVSHVMMCMNCGCDFTLTLRRHHCHACGKIVCRNCSRNKYPMKYLKDQAAKVCDSCYVEFKKRERPLSMSFPPTSLTSSRCSSSAFSSVFHNIHYSSFKKQKKIPSALMEVAASGEGATISGYLSRCKRGKRHWKKRWFVIKGKVLYTYIANEDKVATESLPLLGFTIAPENEEGSTDSVFHLYHKQTLFYSFRAEDNDSAQRWIEAMEEASIL
ncbi:FYVE, RhoGEF and PH domain-containing protein 5 isoform X2 [Calypte anna]|uniref:FYVE, RhoGEF and PH domain-containing protein 5 isoform X2 n=1 Tax=Calypte anna TaxID=9244 RepID=UPI0011C38043|nr:FYVE, RhoGEF and PH domain-containing protein 5 isoform X2 [Calypte anna]